MKMKNSEIAIAVIKEGVIKPTFASVYTFLDAWSYLFFGRHIENLHKRGIYEIKLLDGTVSKLRRKNNVKERF